MIFPLAYPLILYNGKPFYQWGQHELANKKEGKVSRELLKGRFQTAAADDTREEDAHLKDEEEYVDDDQVPELFDDPSLNIPTRFAVFDDDEMDTDDEEIVGKTVREN